MLGSTGWMAPRLQPATEASKGARRVIVSEDLPLTVLTAVATTLVMNAIGLGRTFLYVGVALSPLVADVIKNAFRGLRKLWLSLLAALLVLLGTAAAPLAARLRAREHRRDRLAGRDGHRPSSRPSSRWRSSACRSSRAAVRSSPPER